MKTASLRDSGLALIALGALTIYILACTSFSPDDRRVLYPTFDQQSGAIGIAVYDRKARRSETVFLPRICEETNKAEMLLRAQWLHDGRVLACWLSEKGADGLNLTLLPVGGRGPVRQYVIPGLDDAEAQFMMPVPIVGDRAFFVGADEGLVLRLDLRKGTVESFRLQDTNCNISLFPAPDGSAIFYFEEGEDSAQIFGKLDPGTLRRTPTITFTNKLIEGSFLACSKEADRIAVVEETEPAPRVIVLRARKAPVSKPLGARAKDYRFGNAYFAPNGKALVASFFREDDDKAAFGIMEIPLTPDPIRETILISSAKIDDETAALYFQMGVSHDGKTAAVASTYLACVDKEFKAEDCALFLVDLADPKRKVRKVAIPMPRVRPPAPGDL